MLRNRVGVNVEFLYDEKEAVVSEFHAAIYLVGNCRLLSQYFQISGITIITAGY